MATDSTLKGPVLRSPEIVLWSLVILLAGWFVLPGLGIVLAVVLDFTRLRTSPRAVRLFVLGLGIAVLALQLLFMAVPSWTGGTMGPARPAA